MSIGTAALLHRLAPTKPVVKSGWDSGHPCLGRSRGSAWKLAVSTAGLSVLVAVIVFQLWRVDLRVPLAYHEDAMSHAMHVKGIIEHGWYYDNPLLGAPFGQEMYDFPLGGEHLQLFALKVLGLIFGNVFLTVNVYYLLTFPLVAVSAALFLRWLGVRPGTAAVFATLYAFLPYHFARGTRHLFLSGYYLVPLGVYLALGVLCGYALFDQRRSNTRGRSFLLRFLTRRSLLTLAACVLIGSTSTYFTCFTAFLVMAAAGIRALRQRSLALVAPGAAMAFVLLGTLAIQNVPGMLYSAEHGPNAVVGRRHPGEAEVYGLKPVLLALPAEGHRVPALAAMAERYEAATLYRHEPGQALGFLGLGGLACLLWFAARRVMGGRERDAAPESSMLGPMAVLAVMAVGLATVGGFSAFFSTFVASSLRSWNRMSVIIALLALAALALTVDRLRARQESRTGSRRGPVVLGLGALLVFGLLDQVPGAAALPNHERLAAEYHSDSAFVADIEAALPSGAMVFQLPYRPYPESGRLERAGDTDHFKGYLHSDELRWSFGGVAGREADWQEELRGQPVDMLLARLTSVGFEGIWVDRYAYADEGEAVERDLAALLGPPDVVSDNARLAFFSLRDLPDPVSGQAAQELAEATLHPVRHSWGDGFGSLEEEHDDWWLDAGDRAEVILDNPHGTGRPVTLDLTVQAIGPEARVVQVSYPDGRKEHVEIPAAGAHIHRGLTVNPGSSRVVFSLVSPGPLSPGATPLRLFRPAIYEAPTTAISGG